MKTLLAKMTVCLTASVMVAGIHSCNTVDADPYGGTASVQIEKTGSSDYTEFGVRFIPSSNTVSFRYAIGEASDFGDFVAGTMKEVVNVEGAAETDVLFDNLIPNKVYTIFAVACDENGFEGEVATAKIPTADDNFLLEIQYVTDESAGFTFTATSDYRGGRFYLGTEADRDRFINGEVGEEFKDMKSKTANFFDLQPSTDYVFYAQAIDRAGFMSDVIEIRITTLAEGACPKGEFTYENDIYIGTYSLTPNDKCGQITAFICNEGSQDEMINSGSHWAGDIIAMMKSWESLEEYGQVTIAKNGNPLEMELITPELACDLGLEVYAMYYDNSGNVTGIYRYTAKTPSFDKGAGEAKLTVEVSDITASGATYTYTKGENTFAFMYDSLDADWFDDFKENDPSYHEFYIHDLLFQSGKYWSYGKDVTTFKEETGTPGTRLYAAGCPMNVNGPNGGWGQLVLEEYTTLAE